jgi:hypothetical protein
MVHTILLICYENAELSLFVLVFGEGAIWFFFCKQLDFFFHMRKNKKKQECFYRYTKCFCILNYTSEMNIVHQNARLKFSRKSKQRGTPPKKVCCVLTYASHRTVVIGYSNLRQYCIGILSTTRKL